MNCFKRMLCFSCQQKWKQKHLTSYQGHSGIPDGYCKQDAMGKKGAQPHHTQEKTVMPPCFELRVEENVASLEELAAHIQRDLDQTASWIQADLEKTASWIQADLDKTASWIQLYLQKNVEFHFQGVVKVAGDEINLYMEETAAKIPTDLKELVNEIESMLEENSKQEDKAAEIQYGVDEKSALIQSDLDVNPVTCHHDVVETTRECSCRISLDDFELHKVLGKGSFGKVLLAELKGSGEFYAIKCLNKGSILTNGFTGYTMAEKRVLQLATGNPFLVQLYSAFQTEDNLFFVLEYINGGDLFFHIEERGFFDPVSARFYAAEMTCGLQFLHKNGVIYRDLKLDNVMLDHDGHIRIVDFGLCKDNMLGDKFVNSFCGSEHYIAPEIFRGENYSFPVDWWSFGVLLFEMLTGHTPFYGADDDELYMSVCMDTPHYPSYISQESQDLLKKLLDRDPSRRLGANGNIRVHPFFESIDWLALERREVEPPFKPVMGDNNDCRYFPKEFLNETPRLSWGDCSSIGSVGQSVFEDFSFTNPMWCSTR